MLGLAVSKWRLCGEIGGDEGAQPIVDTLKDRVITFDYVLDEGGAIFENMVPGVNKPVGVVGISEKSLKISSSDNV